MARRADGANRLDDAARAGWLYYVAGRTQDEIAQTMGIPASPPSASCRSPCRSG